MAWGENYMIVSWDRTHFSSSSLSISKLLGSYSRTSGSITSPFGVCVCVRVCFCRKFDKLSSCWCFRKHVVSKQAMWVLWRLGYQWQLPPPSSPVAPGRKCWWGDVFKDLLKGINAFIRQPSPDHGTVLSQPLCRLHTRRGTMHVTATRQQQWTYDVQLLIILFVGHPRQHAYANHSGHVHRSTKGSGNPWWHSSSRRWWENNLGEKIADTLDAWSVGRRKKVPLRHRIKWPCVQWCHAGLPIETAWRRRRRSIQWVYGTGTVPWEERWSPRQVRRLFHESQTDSVSSAKIDQRRWWRSFGEGWCFVYSPQHGTC